MDDKDRKSESQGNPWLHLMIYIYIYIYSVCVCVCVCVFWTCSVQHVAKPGSNIPQNSSCTTIYHSITKTIRVGRNRNAGDCERSKGELISDLLLWTPSNGRARFGRPARTNPQQFCADIGCSLEDLPRAMDGRDRCSERVKKIPTGSATWYIYIYIYIYIYVCVCVCVCVCECKYMFVCLCVCVFMCVLQCVSVLTQMVSMVWL